MSELTPHRREPLPEQFCDLDRLVQAMTERNVDAVLITSGLNMFYLTGFSGIAHKSDEPRPYAMLFSRHAPDDPVVIVADYYLGTMLTQPSWVRDIRSFRAVMMPRDLPAADNDVDRFVPAEHSSHIERLRSYHQESLELACKKAIADLSLSGKTIATDDMRLGQLVATDGSQVTDAYDVMMYARAVKTPFELKKLRAATALNEKAIRHAVGQWQPGMRWRELNHAYHCAVAQLGGFVRDPGALVWGHPRGADAAVTLDTGFDDFVIPEGANMMFDCHGTLDLYCWDGGKTWTVGGQPNANQQRNARATSAASEAVMNAMKPGARISELQTIGRNAFRQAGAPDPDTALIFFHGLGLSHMDVEQYKADGTPNGDWILEENMVVPLHILYPGDERERTWVEEIAQVTKSGGDPYFSWGFDPMMGA